jgi:hypothetical protein
LQSQKETHILIYKKKAVFESVLKNIVSGKFYEIELKHLVILVSVIIFFILVSLCKSDYEDAKIEELTFFEKNVCKNKASVFSLLGVMFIFVIVYGMVKKRINKKGAKKE